MLSIAIEVAEPNLLAAKPAIEAVAVVQVVDHYFENHPQIIFYV